MNYGVFAAIIRAALTPLWGAVQPLGSTCWRRRRPDGAVYFPDAIPKVTLPGGLW